MKNSKKETLSISIPNPCHENWNEMKAEDQGRFCFKCAKTVVDFTQKSKKQIKSYFEEVSGKVCGRFRNEQLVVEPIKVKVNQHKMRIFTWALYLVFGSLLFSCETQKLKVQSKILGQTSCTFGELNPKRMITDEEDIEIIEIINEIGAVNEQRIREERVAMIGYTVVYTAPLIKNIPAEEIPIEDDLPLKCSKIEKMEENITLGLSKIKMR